MGEPVDEQDIRALARLINSHVSGTRCGGTDSLARIIAGDGWRRVGATEHTCTQACAHTVDLMDPITAEIAQALAEGAAGHCAWRHREGPDKLATFARAAAEKAFLAAGWTPPGRQVRVREDRQAQVHGINVHVAPMPPGVDAILVSPPAGPDDDRPVSARVVAIISGSNVITEPEPVAEAARRDQVMDRERGIHAASHVTGHASGCTCHLCWRVREQVEYQ